MIIAVDGPAGSGKSTLSKSIANKLNISYLDTGAMYRMVTYYYLQNNIDLKENLSLEFLLDNIKIDIKDNNFYLNGKNVSKEIREEDVVKNVSKVAALKLVREFLVDVQRKIGNKTDIIMDGRDIGTVVFPNADVKIFLIASADKRAQRRVDQNKELGIDSNYEQILKDIKNRDYLDSTRDISPLKKASDAIEIDTTNDNLEQSQQKILNVIKERTHEI